jgi:hypothetical protein
MKNLFIMLLFIPAIAFAQNEEKKSHFQVGAGFSIGGFYPTEINDQIQSYLDYNNYSISTGTSDMFMYLGGRIFVAYTSSINLGGEVFLEGATSPKYVSVTNGDDVSFFFNRLSPGAKLTYSIQMNRISNLIIGAGLMYNRMKFNADGEKIYGYSWGEKFEVAYQLNFKHIAPRAFIDVNFAKAKDDDYGIDMNYTGAEIGLAFSGLW